LRPAGGAAAIFRRYPLKLDHLADPDSEAQYLVQLHHVLRLGRYRAALAPLSMLVPVFGMGAAVLVLQALPAWKLSPACWAGLAVNLLYRPRPAALSNEPD
jgi:hypothetical protein